MQPAPRSSVAYFIDEVRAPIDYGWLQAGFSGIAYRLAHLSVSRSVAVAGVAMAFYFI